MLLLLRGKIYYFSFVNYLFCTKTVQFCILTRLRKRHIMKGEKGRCESLQRRKQYPVQHLPQIIIETQ